MRPDARVGDLSVGERQRVEILKALYRGARILILDEPTVPGRSLSRPRHARLAASERARDAGRVVVSSPPSWLGDQVEVPAGTDRFTLPSGEEVAVEALETGEALMLWKVDRARPAPSRPTLRILALGRHRAALEQIGGVVELSPRHSEILTLLALHPEGLSGEQLAGEIYGADVKAATVRAEMSRLRRLLGCLLLARPYRLVADIDADFLAVERLVRAGDHDAAISRHRGPLLPRSKVPGIVEARERLECGLRRDQAVTASRSSAVGPGTVSMPSIAFVNSIASSSMIARGLNDGSAMTPWTRRRCMPKLPAS